MMTHEEIRFECLKLAAASGVANWEVKALAEEWYQFVLGLVTIVSPPNKDG